MNVTVRQRLHLAGWRRAMNVTVRQRLHLARWRRVMKIKFVFMPVLLCGGLSAPAMAADVSIAVIDPNRIVEESPQYQEARRMLSTEKIAAVTPG